MNYQKIKSTVEDSKADTEFGMDEEGIRRLKNHIKQKDIWLSDYIVDEDITFHLKEEDLDAFEEYYKQKPYREETIKSMKESLGHYSGRESPYHTSTLKSEMKNLMRKWFEFLDDTHGTDILDLYSPSPEDVDMGRKFTMKIDI